MWICMFLPVLIKFVSSSQRVKYMACVNIFHVYHFVCGVVWDWVIHLALWFVMVQLYQPQMINAWIWRTGRVIIDRGKMKYSEKNVWMPLSLPRSPLALPWDWNQASVLRSQQLIAWAMMLPCACSCITMGIHSCSVSQCVNELLNKIVLT